MIVVDPISMMGDAVCTRPSPKWVYDRTGTLVEVPPDTLAVTYDPSDLSKAPYALLEPEARNLFRFSEQFDNSAWIAWHSFINTDAALAPDGASTAEKLVENGTTNSHSREQTCDFVAGQAYTFSAYLRAGERTAATLRMKAAAFGIEAGGHFDLLSGAATPLVNTSTTVSMESLPGNWWRCSVTAEAASTNSAGVWIGLLNAAGTILYQGDGLSGLYIWGAQIELGSIASSYIRTGSSAVTRAADVIGATAGLIYSNVPMGEPPYDAATTYAKDAAVYDPATKIVYWSMIDANTGNALSDGSKWNQRTAINRAAMFDERNDTQTVNPDEILVVLSAKAITQGLYLGNLDSTEIRVAMTDLRTGLVYSEQQNQILSSSKSSFFRWAFNRIRRRTYFLTLRLPVYANALVTILIRRQGGNAKCGMCMLGPAIDVGLSHYGLSTELKDFSSTTLNPDGTSKTVLRGYAKRMSVDVEIDNDVIDSVEDELIGFRQKVVVWVGTVLFGSAMLVGKFSSLKKVIPRRLKSTMSLQIEGVVTK